MSVEELIKNHDPKLILTAAERIKQTEEICKRLLGSRWSGVPLNFGGDTFILPGISGYRPLAVTPHVYGLWMEPLVTAGKDTKRPFALHINESEEGLVIYVSGAFRIVLDGDHDAGFTLEMELEENTSIQEEDEA